MRFRHALREMRTARAVYIRSRMLMSRKRRGGGVLFLMYHGVAGSARSNFTRQLQLLRNHGDFVGVSDSLEILKRPPAADRHICLSFDDGKHDAFRHALPILAARGVPAVFFLVSDWVDSRKEGGIGWAEVRQLVAAGMTIGSHSVTHRRLAGLDASAARAEMTVSRARIEAASGRACEHFAAPFGQPGEDYLPDRDPALARDSGYQTLFTTLARGAVAGDDPWCLPRVRMESCWGGAELRYALLRY